MSRRGRYALIFFAGYAVWFATFYAVGTIASKLVTRDLTTDWDRALPLVPWMVWPYELCYVFPLLIFYAVKNWHRFNVAVLAMIVANLTAYVVYLMFPIAFPRPVLGDSIAEQVLALEYAADFHPGANKLPSMHVAITWIVWCAMRGERSLRFDLFTAALGVAITVSTVLVKQHIVVDVGAGLVWGFGAWWVASRLYQNRIDLAGTPEEGLRAMFSRSTWRHLACRSKAGALPDTRARG